MLGNPSSIYLICLVFYGGRAEIRTLGAVTLGGFQDRCLKPLGHPSIVMRVAL